MKWRFSAIRGFTTEELRAVEADLSPTRAQRIGALRRPEDRDRSLAAELLARRLLKEEFGVSHPILHAAPGGQPILPDSGLHLSITHSGQYVACAVSEVPVGMDMEVIRPMDLAIARHVCTQEEMAYLFGRAPTDTDFRKTDNPAVLQRFFEIWTGKEAWFKMQGTGILNLRGIHILPLPRQIILRDGCLITIMEKTV